MLEQRGMRIRSNLPSVGKNNKGRNDDGLRVDDNYSHHDPHDPAYAVGGLLLQPIMFFIGAVASFDWLKCGSYLIRYPLCYLIRPSKSSYIIGKQATDPLERVLRASENLSR